jgi:murein DD-endopeptidase MepM/ murein hydrolase activator NlpD
MFRKTLLSIVILTAIARAGIDLRLPTENHHLFTGESERFYMYVDRIFEGEASKPWEAGSFGFVRNAMRINGQVILTKFHEGIDISPVNRDKAGNPLDLVSSIADGRVAHVSPISGRSNYGKYVVVEHLWENSSIYSLYAHLAEITCNPGDPVKAGSVLGRMGYTGAGIDRTRAHCHLELGMMMSLRFDDWSKGSINYQGNFNGINLAGSDVARFFIEHKANPELTFSSFIANTPVHFKVTVPSKGTPDFVKRHSWICKSVPENTVSWEISFSATGMPVAFAPSQREVESAAVTSVRPSAIPQRYLTRNLISGQHNHATLTTGGKQLVALLMDDFPASKGTPAAEEVKIHGTVKPKG